MSTNDNYDPDKEKQQHEAAAAAAGAAGSVLGCLGFMFMPWTIFIVIFVLLAVVWMFVRH